MSSACLPVQKQIPERDNADHRLSQNQGGSSSRKMAAQVVHQLMPEQSPDIFSDMGRNRSPQGTSAFIKKDQQETENRSINKLNHISMIQSEQTSGNHHRPSESPEVFGSLIDHSTESQFFRHGTEDPDSDHQQQPVLSFIDIRGELGITAEKSGESGDIPFICFQSSGIEIRQAIPVISAEV